MIEIGAEKGKEIINFLRKREKEMLEDAYKYGSLGELELAFKYKLRAAAIEEMCNELVIVFTFEG